MKKLLRLMLVVAFFICNVNLFADEDNSGQVTIGSESNSDLSTPFVMKSTYSWNETIYPGSEIGSACVINAISYNSVATESQQYPVELGELDIYMAVTEKYAFGSEADWIPADKLIKVYSGNNIVVGDTPWEKITLDVPFYFNGNGNLVVVVAKKANNWNLNSLWHYTKDIYTSTLYYGNDLNENIADNPPTTSDQGSRTTYRANIMLDVVYGMLESPIVVTPNPIDLGMRPVGAWMRPATVTFSTESMTAHILSVESTSPSFVVSTFQAPAEVSVENPFSVSIKHANSNVVGELKGELKVANNFGNDVVEMKATTYMPVSPDVWEKAEEVSYYPYADTPDFDNLYDNYLLPGEEKDGPDAVYKLTFDKETTLSVAVNGTNAKLALYDNDFNGKGGPDFDNYYGTTIDPDQPSEPEFPEVELPELQGTSFSFDFEDGSIAEWRTIDIDGDNFNWGITTDGKINAGAGVKCLYSLSYNASTGSPLTPDNYIVTKGSYTIDRNSVLEFDVSALDHSSGYYNETYEVVISTDGINFESFGKEKIQDPTWNHKSFSLDSYIGQNVVIGFRHYESTNESAVLIDNVVLTSGRARAGVRYNKTEKYTVPAGTYYLAVSATERFSVNINATTQGGYNPVTEVYAQEVDDNSIDVKWSWDFIAKNLTLSNGRILSKTNRDNADATVSGYNVYRKNTTTDEITLLEKNVTDTSYVDNTWNNMTMGLYQWGVSVIYDDNGEPYETPVAYSNTIGKDMFTTLDVAVATENGASPAGTKVSLFNVYEPSFKYEVILDETGTYHWDSFRRGTYRYTMSLEGYKPGPQNEQIEIWDASELEYTFEEIFVLGDLFVSSTGWAMWKPDLDGDEPETFTVSLDEEVVAEVWDYYYQFDVTNLVVGQEYTAKVSDMEYTWTYIPCDNFVQASDFEVESEGKDALVYWTLPVQGYSESSSEFKFDFEDETLNGWIVIDADKDGYSWANSKNYSQTECGYQSWYSAMSHSCVGNTPLTPDNYMATAKKYLITENSKLIFNVSAESNKYAEEHYGIAISTESNYIVEDFETIWEETLPKEENVSGYHGVWYTRTVDLSAYAGKSVYIAFRHFNCSDEFWINIDNVELTTKEQTRKKEGEWLYYDNGVNYDAIILQGGASFYYAMMFPAEDMAEFIGQSITKISMFDFSEHEGRFMIYFGGDKSPGTLVHSQDYSCAGTKEYVEYELTNTVDISGEQNVWFVFYSSVAPCCVGPTNANGRWFSQNGTQWDDVVNKTGYNVTWQVRAFVEEVPIPNSTDLEVLGIMLFRDGKLLTETPVTDETFVETLPEYGDYEYSLRVVYGGEEESYYAMSCPQTLTLNHVKVCKAPKDLYGASVLNPDGTIGAALEWPYTLHGSDWLHYDNGNYDTGIGTGGSIYWGIMFPAEDLGFYDGTVITKVAMFDHEYHDGNILIYYGGDNAPDMLIHSQPYSGTGSKQFVEYTLTTPIPVDATTNLWIVFNNRNGSWPASCCKNTGNPNGRWMSTDGVNWADIATVPTMECTWMIRAYVTSEMKGAKRSEDVFSHYNVYRGTSKDDLELIAQPTQGNYFDEVEVGTYYYKVTSTYFEGDVECESAAANSYNEPENDYVVVDVTSINENGVNVAMIYPNPTNSNLNITAEGLNHITVFNALGQMMYDNDVSDENAIINMSGYDAGVYMVRIMTENGMMVKRVSVVK